MKRLFLYFFAFSILLNFLSFFFSLNQVIGTGMEPTIKHKQLALFRKYFLFSSPNPNRGDIILYYSKNASNYSEHVSRVIGLPLEAIMFKNGNFYLDNNYEIFRVEEEYLPKNVKTRQFEENEWIKLSQFEYLVAKDSRQEPVDIKNNIVHKNDIKGSLFVKF